MILWILLFVLVLAISFVLAVKSMKDYAEIYEGTGQNFCLFLVRKTSGLNSQFFKFLHDDLLVSGKNISFERLFRGKESALVVFGPADLLTHFKDSLDLLELEDYTNVGQDYSGWEVGFKERVQGTGYRVEGIFDGLPQFSNSDQFWWQLILWAGKDKQTSGLFQSQIRAVIVSGDPARRKSLTQSLQSLASGQLFKLPGVFSSEQIINFYKKRSFQKNENPDLNFGSILKLLQV